MDKLPGALGAALLLFASSARAQSIDPSIAHAVLGRPLSLEVRMRGGSGWPTLRPACIHVELVIGDQYLGPDDVAISVREDPQPGWQRIRLAHPMPVTEPAFQARIAITCGPTFTREFPVLADRSSAPAERTRRSKPRSAATSHQRLEPLPVAARTQLAPPSTTQPLAPPAPTNDGSAARASPKEAFNTEEFDRLRLELRRTQAALSSVEARISHASGAKAGWWWPAAGIATALFAAPLFGWLRRARPRPRPRVRVDTAETPSMRGRPQDRADAVTGGPQATASTTSTTPAAVPSHTTTTPVTSRDRSKAYAHADFGQPDLDNALDPAQLREIERLIDQGFHGGAVALAEHYLQKSTGKNPWLLLCLLDLYADMGQPWNQERVAAQLEVLYNVRLPALEAPDFEGQSLESNGNALEAVQRDWGRPGCLGTLAWMLLRTEDHPPLDLAAFRDTLLLHAIVQAQRPDSGDPTPFDPLIDWAPPG